MRARRPNGRVRQSQNLKKKTQNITCGQCGQSSSKSDGVVEGSSSDIRSTFALTCKLQIPCHRILHHAPLERQGAAASHQTRATTAMSTQTILLHPVEVQPTMSPFQAPKEASRVSNERKRAMFLVLLFHTSCIGVQSFSTRSVQHRFTIPRPVAQNNKNDRFTTARKLGFDTIRPCRSGRKSLTSTAIAAVQVPAEDKEEASPVLGQWPCFDKLDRQLIKISLPVIANFAINPLIGAVDLFWVNRMGDALAVAGQSAANQVFSSVFWFTSFLPSGTQNYQLK
jgi:hypothetical protein